MQDIRVPDPRSSDSRDDADLAFHGLPQVAMPANRWSGPLLFGAAGLLGVVVFSTLSYARDDEPSLIKIAAGAPPISGDAPAAPVLSGAPGPDDEPLSARKQEIERPAVDTGYTAPANGEAVSAQARLRSPLLIVDLSPEADEAAAAEEKKDGADADAPAAAGAAGAAASTDRQAINERFAREVSSEEVETARATKISSPGTTVLQGTVIPAVLETALNSDLPGFSRAVVSQDVRSFDGATVLIPRGSRVLGQYRSGVSRGQSRAFVIWSRLIRPDGVSIQLGSPGGDALGRAGLSGSVDNHFVRIFGSALLLSVITAGSNSLSNDGDARLIVSQSQDASSAVTGVLQKETDIPPTIKVPQGTPMRIFVAKDLDFSLPTRTGSQRASR